MNIIWIGVNIVRLMMRKCVSDALCMEVMLDMNHLILILSNIGDM